MKLSYFQSHDWDHIHLRFKKNSYEHIQHNEKVSYVGLPCRSGGGGFSVTVDSVGLLPNRVKLATWRFGRVPQRLTVCT